MSQTKTRRPVLVLGSVPYDTYVQLRDARKNRGLRMAYHDGVLEIMSPEYLHDAGVFHLSLIVVAYCKVFEIPGGGAGSTTFRKGVPGELKGRGKEPDASFYLGAEAVKAIQGKSFIELSVDPPPSLWIEVDNWGSSKARLPIYAALGVPEVWRFRRRKGILRIGRLDENSGRYLEAESSFALPGLTPAIVLDLLAQHTSADDIGWSRWLEQVWFPAHRAELTGGA